MKIKMLGHVDADGTIDIEDITLITALYGFTEEPHWNPQTDLAPEYEIIDIVDVVTATSRYHQSCPS